MLAYTGLETVANLAEETLEPGVSLPRSLMRAIGAVVAATTLTAVVGLSAFPVHNGQSELGAAGPLADGADPRDRRRARPAPPALGGLDPARLRRALRRRDPAARGLDVDLRLSAGSPTRSASTDSCRASSAASTAARSSRRTRSSAAAVDLDRAPARRRRRSQNPIAALASLYSFGVLFAFLAAQLAVLRLRVTAPDLPRPFRVPSRADPAATRSRSPTLVGAALTLAVWVVALATHPAARYGGPLWMAGRLRRLPRRPPRPRRGAPRARRLRRRAGAPGAAARRASSSR